MDNQYQCDNLVHLQLVQEVIYSHQCKGLQCNLICRYIFLYDCEPHSLHLQHSHMDLHIFHCGKHESWGNQDLSNIHMVYILHKGYLCVLLDTCI
jgi:hypothetical protein